MQEELKCSRCEQKWERERCRGRKPLFCPACVALQIQEDVDQPKIIKPLKVVEKSIRVYTFFIPGPSEWVCDHCDETLRVLIGLTDVPMHCCNRRRSLSFPFIQKFRKSKEKNESPSRKIKENNCV